MTRSGRGGRGGSTRRRARGLRRVLEGRPPARGWSAGGLGAIPKTILCDLAARPQEPATRTDQRLGGSKPRRSRGIRGGRRRGAATERIRSLRYRSGVGSWRRDSRLAWGRRGQSRVHGATPARRSGPKLSSVASPLGAGNAGKDRGASGVGPCGRAGVRGNREEKWIQRSKSMIVPFFKFTEMLICTG